MNVAEAGDEGIKRKVTVIRISKQRNGERKERRKGDERKGDNK